MKKKGTVFITIVIIAVVIAIFAVSIPQAVQKKTAPFESSEHYAEAVSTAMYQAIENSIARSTYNMGDFGFQDINNSYWISYSLPLVPSVEDINERLEVMINDTVNDYMGQLSAQQLGDTVIERVDKISHVTVNVDQDDVIEGEHDNSFSVTAHSGRVRLNSENNQKAYQDTGFDVPIDNWRFWFMYRVIREWALQNSFSKEACNMLPEFGVKGGRECPYLAITDNTIDNLLEQKILELNETFFNEDNGHQYVECNHTIICRVGVTNIDPHNKDCPDVCDMCELSNCVYLNRIRDCEITCDPDPVCGNPGDALLPPCEEGEIRFDEYRFDEEECSRYHCEYFSGDCYGLGVEHTWSVISEITCTDHKNRKPISEEGIKELGLRFRIHTYFYRYHDAYIDCINNDEICPPETPVIPPQEPGSGGAPGGSGGDGSGG
ncbi:hypothetical protein JW930_02760 [Candidatus Woesearchaeota archaeon]|nr:hypothetical protein [Candidatus Woesearchaeota archaeon]